MLLYLYRLVILLATSIDSCRVFPNMGLVLSNLSAGHLADKVNDLGDAYRIYGEGIIANRIDSGAILRSGGWLGEDKTKDTGNSLFNLVRVAEESHRREIKAHFVELVHNRTLNRR